MDTSLIERIDREIEAQRAQIVNDTIHFVGIKSTLGEPKPGAPFGEGPRKMLDEFMSLANSEGYFVRDYGTGVVSASMDGGNVDLGIWLHGDVVPEGDGWIYPPYDAREYNGCIIGRGAGDNKGQLSSAYNLFRIFKRLGIKLNYNPAIYLGSDEESGMRDVVGIEGNPDARGFINVATPPRISLVPDGSFPVAYGGDGSMRVKLKSKEKMCGFDFVAGSEEAPGLAVAHLYSLTLSQAYEKCELSDDGRALSCYTLPRHGTNPDPDGNMITFLSQALLSVDKINDSDKSILKFLHDISLDVRGERVGIAMEDTSLGKIIVYPKSVDTVDGHAEITLVVRYPHGMTYDELCSAFSRYADERGFLLSQAESRTKPYLLDKSSDTVKLLCTVANSVCGGDAEPYVMKGGTYAHNLPNAYVFGTSANLAPTDFPAGHGSVHGVDEAVSIDRLIRMMKIYARALLALNDIL